MGTSPTYTTIFGTEEHLGYSGFGSAILKTGIPKHFRVRPLQLCLYAELKFFAPGTVKLTRVLPLPTTTTPQPNSHTRQIKI